MIGEPAARHTQPFKKEHCSMPNTFSRFMRLYSTTLLSEENAIVIADPVRIEIFRGSRHYDTLVPGGPRVVALGVSLSFPAVKTQQLNLPEDRTYIELTATTHDPAENPQYCEDQINRVIAQLSAILSPQLFETEVWRGWLAPAGLFSQWMTVARPVTFKAEDVEREIESFRRALTANLDVDNSRFTLMSNLFARALLMETGAERFLWLWTVLEVFPMKETSDIRSVCDHLSSVTGRTATELKEKLRIGRLFGARSDLVHKGKLPYEGDELGSNLRKLETIDRVVIRSLGGLAYTGELDEFMV
jgi:hypothetical protein